MAIEDGCETVGDDNIGWLLHRALRSYNEGAIEGIRSRGHDRLGLAHAAILPHITQAGVRLTDVAAAAGISKQSASQFVRELEAFGYLRRTRSAADKRADCITFTEAGLRFREDARAVKRAQEAELSKVLGGEGKRQLARFLALMAGEPGS